MTLEPATETPIKPAIPAYRREHLERVGDLAELMAGHGITVESRRIPHLKDSGFGDSKWNASALHCAFDVLHNGRKVYSGEYSAGLGAAWPDTLKEFGEAVKCGRRALPGLGMIFPGDVSRAFKAGWQGRKVCDESTVECFKAGWRPDPVDIMQSLLASVTDESFADWCSSLGYDEDSRRAHAMMAAHMDEENRPMESLWDISTGITAYAKGIPFQNDRVAIEREAGKVLDLAA